MLFRYIFIIYLLFYSWQTSAQENDTTVLILDQIQFDVQSVEIKKDTAIVNLFLISEAVEREFKMNTYASVIVDQKHEDHMFSTIKMGRVLVSRDDKTNYLHYLLKQDIPVSLQFKIYDWQKEYGKPQSIHIVFEDSQEQGRFRQVNIKF